MATADALAATLVDDAPQHLKQARRAVDFVQHDQAVLVRVEIQLDIRQLGPVGRELEVEVDGTIPVPVGERSGQRRLAGLAGAQEDDARKLPQPIPNHRLGSPSQHPCNYSTLWNNCKDLQDTCPGAWRPAPGTRRRAPAIPPDPVR